jgi:hypothetical protein
MGENMKFPKYTLLSMLFLSAFFQLLIALWMLIDIKTTGSIFFGISSTSSEILISNEFSIVAKMDAKAFLLLLKNKNRGKI